MKAFLKKVQNYHEARFREEGSSARGLDWKSEEAQQLNFATLLNMMPDRSASVLDVGCGLAHLRDFLVANGYTGAYTGIDVSPLLIEEARRRCPGADLRVQELLAGPRVTQSFDYVVASGIFTGSLGTPVEEFEAYIGRALDAMYGLCRFGTIFNMLTTFVDFRAPHLYYADPGIWLSRAARHSRFLRLQHDSESYLFALGIYRQPNGYASDPILGAEK